ncbi:MAG: amidohydrolase family protein, partial [Deltaproteobacteria bacterium]|nr:amidohydrolase family protein [Deltaproteobacteria bacterium]
MNALLQVMSVLFAVASVWPAAAVHAESAPGSRTDRPIALVGGMLLDGYEAAPIHDAVVVMKGRRIIAAGTRTNVEIPKDAHLIDTRGKTIMPGLVDLHIHLDLIGHGDYTRYYEFLGGLERLPEVMPIAAKQLLRAGVTSAVDLGTPFEILAVRKQIDEGLIPGPRLSVSGPWITRTTLEGVLPEYEHRISSPREARRRTRENIERGADVIKTWLGLTLEELEAVVDEAHKHDVKVHTHLYDPDDIKIAIQAGVDVLQHMGSARNPPYAEELVRMIAHRQIPMVQTVSHRIWVYPATVAFPGRLSAPVLERDMPADIYAELQASFQDFHRLSYFSEIGTETRNSSKAAHQFIDAGAYMGVGTDSASPLNFHTEAMAFEMAALVDLGMTPIQVISAAT